MKKIIYTALLLIALCMPTVFTACSANESYGETFKGYLSEETYNSEASAVRAFLKEQLDGTTAECTLKNYSPNKILTASEIDELGIDGKIYSATDMTVHYTDGNLKDCKTSLYVVRSSNGFRYFAPLPKSGEAVTSSYYNSVLSNKAYNNCTVTTTYSGHYQSLDATYLQTFKFDYTKAYFNQTIPSMQVDFYMEQTDDGFEYYSRLPVFGDNKYYTDDEMDKKIKEIYGSNYYFTGYVLKKGSKEYPLDSFADISELSMFIYAADFDGSYFVKTDYGFCMPFEKFKQAVYSMTGTLGEYASTVNSEINEHIASLNIEYYVSEGRLSKIDYTLQAIIGDDPKDLMSTEMHSLFTDFGTTEVILPL